MATRALSSLMRCSVKKMQVRPYYTTHDKIGSREVVAHGCSGEPIYVDASDFPMPAIRYKEITPDIQVLREKEKQDWKKLSIEDKKQLYRASFRQTFAEMEAPSGDWKYCIGVACIGITISLWLSVLLKWYVYPPLPESFSDVRKAAQYRRMQIMDVNPIDGLASKNRLK